MLTGKPRNKLQTKVRSKSCGVQNTNKTGGAGEDLPAGTGDSGSRRRGEEVNPAAVVSRQLARYLSKPYDEVFRGVSKLARARSTGTKRSNAIIPLAKVDRLDRDFCLPGRVGKNLPNTTFTQEIGRTNPTLYKREGKTQWFPLFGRDGSIPSTKINLESGYMRVQRNLSGFYPAFNKLMRFFGKISKEKHFKFLLKLMTFAGFSKRDFKMAVRLRDLWVRDDPKFKKCTISYIFGFPVSYVEYISALGTRSPRARRR